MNDKLRFTPAMLRAFHRYGDVSRGTPEAIEASEQAGQDSLVAANSWLPKDGPRESIQEHGIRVLDDSDELFYQVELPDGWKIAPTDHPMWTNLLDEKESVVAEIFYKAAFYDRRASIHWCDKKGGKKADNAGGNGGE